MLAAAEPAPVHSLENFKIFLAHALLDCMLKTASCSTEFKNHVTLFRTQVPARARYARHLRVGKPTKATKPLRA